MKKRTIGKCRFYCDISSYLKHLGYYSGSNYMTITSNEYSYYERPNMFGLDPLYKLPKSAWVTDEGGWDTSNFQKTSAFEFNINPEYEHEVGGNFFGTDEYPRLTVYKNTQLQQILKNVNYAGILHTQFPMFQSFTGNQGLEAVGRMYLQFMGYPEGSNEQGDNFLETSQLDSTDGGTTEIINYDTSTQKPRYPGTSLWEINGFTEDMEEDYCTALARIRIDTISENTSDLLGNGYFKATGITFGRYFEPSHSFDLKVTSTHEFEGITATTTEGGSTLINKKNVGQPAWGGSVKNSSPWGINDRPTIDTHYDAIGNSPRRSWKVSLSFMTDDNLFHKSSNPNQFFTWTDPDNEDGTPEYVFDDSMASFFKFTFNGGLPFIFCPDKDADNLEFAICRLASQPKFEQVAIGTFNTTLDIVEAY